MNIQRKIAIALALDPLFKSYQLTWTPEEAVEYAKQVPSLGKANSRALVRLVQGINAAVPAAKGRAGHVLRIGRHCGRRLVEVDVLDSWPKEGRIAMERIDVLAKRAGSKSPDSLLDESMTTLRMVWK